MHPKIPIVNIENCNSDVAERMACRRRGEKEIKSHQEKKATKASTLNLKVIFYQLHL